VTDPWGIDPGYHDVGGGWHEPRPEHIAALRAAMGAKPGDDGPPARRPLWFVQQGTSPELLGPAALLLDDGTTIDATGALPPDLPLGYHDLVPVDGGPATRVIVTPRRAHLPDDLRGWLWAAQLYATRSTASWGIGDLADLRDLARFTAAVGGAGVLVNPLHAVLPTPEQQPSPYFPSSRRFRNPLYLRIENVPGASDDAEVTSLAARARELNEIRSIDRDMVWALKRRALERLWSRFHGDARFHRYDDEQGEALHRYATFCALADHHGTGWDSWPAEHRRPDEPAVASFAAAHSALVSFHAWLQWLLHEQLLEASAEVPIIHDLAIGVDPAGADAWLHQDVLALDVHVGAPPDIFSADGQDWGLPPFIPWKLREAAYEPFIAIVRAALHGAGGLRIDHVMGLSRIYWIPPGATAADGTYVRFPGTELLDILTVESARAGAIVIGEDLGTVEDELRAQLHERAILSYRLVLFEDQPPEHFPEQALAAVTTHDLPTIAGLWTGADLAEQEKLGSKPNLAAAEGLRTKLAELTELADDAPVTDVVEAVHRRLARAPSRLVAATLEDALGVQERPNLPGTMTERPNWSLALPEPLESIVTDPSVKRLADGLRRE
jgi:4-alpha-glucanotransferase